MKDPEVERIFHELAETISYKWRLKSVANKARKPYPEGTRGQFLAYIDARDVFNQFDRVIGNADWQSQVMRVNEDGSVIVRLSIRVNGEWIIREDVGYSNNPGSDVEEEPLKAAVSDGVKRAAVHFGVGRFLYEIPAVWTGVDANGQPLRPIGTGSIRASHDHGDVDRSTGEITPAPSPARVTSHPGAEQAASGESPRDGAARTLWNEAKALGFDKKSLDLFCIDRTNHTLDKADTQALIKLRSELKFVEDIPALIDFLTNRPERHAAPAPEPAPVAAEESQPCAIDGCTGTCLNSWVDFSIRRYGVVLCSKHSAMAKRGELESELQALNSVATR